MDGFTPKPHALEKAFTFLRIYHNRALKKYPYLVDQLPLFNAKPTYDPPIIHFSPASGGFKDDYLEDATYSMLSSVAKDWLENHVKESVPPQLLEDIINGDCIVFLGAGASTEGIIGGPRLFDIISKKCNYPGTFPNNLSLVSQYFCETIDGGQKGRLVRLIRSVIDEYMKNGESYSDASECQSYIAKIPQLKVIVTTNWDVFMERLINVIAIVRDEDMVYWNDKDRQVIKLHGCIAQPSTMVITKDDYDQFVATRMSTPIANKLADFMATKTLLFIGYSFSDVDFTIFHKRILSQIGKFSRHSFAVMPNPKKALVEEWKIKNITIIPARGQDFLKKLHGILTQKGLLFPDNIIDKMLEKLEEIIKIHPSVNNSQETNVGMLSSMYQDGLQHELKLLTNVIGWGFSRLQLDNKLSVTKNKLEMFMMENEPSPDTITEIAYWSGRIAVMIWLLSDGKTELKLFFSNSLHPINREEYYVELGKAK